MADFALAGLFTDRRPRVKIGCQSPVKEPPMDVAELQLIPTRLSQHDEPLTDRHLTPTRHGSDKWKGNFTRRNLRKLHA